ncbi:hypothetical protein CUMW_226360 [Citrus unshiu]|uniref:PGG domain-containing protein n=1 Tax=Citrus unshiu TaxID=55188 RepID=A0A2H5QG24_CITUN|nr:hypothetical protein CUMW_226360 [Citrus unshiu]
MDPDLYKAAAKGEIDPFNKIAKDHLGSILTHNKNTVLHVNIASQTHKQNREGEIGLMKSHNRNQVHHVHLVTNLFQIQIHNRGGESVSTKFVEQILEMCPSLLLQVNAKGLPQDLESGVESTARQMLGMTNDEKNTALHEAVQHGSLDVVKMLIKADPDVPYSANCRGETPLYMAAARGIYFYEMVAEISENCPSAAHEGPNGKTALHAAAISYEPEKETNTDGLHSITPRILQEIGELTEADGSGQYPEGVVKMKKDKIEKYSFWKFVDENVIGMTEASESHLVVAALIATVTFAAAFTLPGGYKTDNEDGRNRGTAILTKNAAFQAFVVSDAIAMVLSLSAVFVHFILSLKLFRKFICLFVFALLLTLVAMIAMVVAFITGTYAVLSPSLGLAIVTCFIGLTFFLLVIFMFYQALKNVDDED